MILSAIIKTQILILLSLCFSCILCNSEQDVQTGEHTIYIGSEDKQNNEDTVYVYLDPKYENFYEIKENKNEFSIKVFKQDKVKLAELEAQNNLSDDDIVEVGNQPPDKNYVIFLLHSTKSVSFRDNIDNLKLYNVRDITENKNLVGKIWGYEVQVVFIQKLNNKKYKFIEVYTTWEE